jgi:hypothetical protein
MRRAVRAIGRSEVSILTVAVIGFMTQSGCARYSESSRSTSSSGITAEVGTSATYAFGSDNEIVTLVGPRSGQKTRVFESECNGMDPFGARWTTKNRLEISCDGIEIKRFCGERTFTVDGEKVIVSVKCP